MNNGEPHCLKKKGEANFHKGIKMKRKNKDKKIQADTGAPAELKVQAPLKKKKERPPLAPDNTKEAGHKVALSGGVVNMSKSSEWLEGWRNGLFERIRKMS